jgi:hypothetical protein
MLPRRPPAQSLLNVADALEAGVASFVEARNSVQADGTWEAPLEAWAISNLLVRNIEAAVVLARHDETLAPAAWANARNVFDAAWRILWLLTPPERFESEGRWVALLAEYERFHRRMSQIPEVSAEEISRHIALAEQIDDLRGRIASKLPRGYQVPTRIPAVNEVLDELGVAGMYRLYFEGSQYMHSTMSATRAYRRNDRTERSFGDFVELWHWILPLRTCWICLHNAGRFVVSRLGDPAEWEVPPAFKRRMDAAFLDLANASSEKGS